MLEQASEAILMNGNYIEYLEVLIVVVSVTRPSIKKVNIGNKYHLSYVIKDSFK